PRPPSAADRRTRLDPESLRGLLLLPRQADRRPARWSRRPGGADVYRGADHRDLRAWALRRGLRVAVGARVVHRDVPAPRATAPRPLVARPARPRGSARLWRLLRAVRHRPP